MSLDETPQCPECSEPEAVDRRDFMRVVGGTAVVLAGATLTPIATAGPHHVPFQVMPRPRPAEGLCRELWSTLTNDQKRQLVLPWDSPNRTRFFNAPMNVRISAVYTRGQQELLQEIMRAISSGDDGYNKLARGGSWDT